MSQYTKEEMWKIFEKLPPELKTAVFSQETADTIWETSERNGLGGEQTHQIGKLVGDSLMGLLHPEDLAQTIIDETGLSPEQASNVARDINRLIMFPVKSYLYDFYKDITFVPSGKVLEGKIVSGPHQTQQRPIQPSQSANARQKQKRADTYRENLE